MNEKKLDMDSYLRGFRAGMIYIQNEGKLHQKRVRMAVEQTAFSECEFANGATTDRKIVMNAIRGMLLALQEQDTTNTEVIK